VDRDCRGKRDPGGAAPCLGTAADDHQLIGDVVDALGRRVEQVRIIEIRDNIFYAELILDQKTKVSALRGSRTRHTSLTAVIRCLRPSGMTPPRDRRDGVVVNFESSGQDAYFDTPGEASAPPSAA
jgi:hypothetical protein